MNEDGIKEWLAAGNPEQPDGFDSDTNDLPWPESAAERVEAWIGQFGDGLCAVDNGQPLYRRDLAALVFNVDTTRTVRSALQIVKKQLDEASQENEKLRAELDRIRQAGQDQKGAGTE